MDLAQILTTSGAVGAFGLAFGTYWRVRPAMKKVQIEGESALWAEINKLRAEARAEQEKYGLRIAEMEATIADLRHDLANETASLDAFLLLAETSPERVIHHLPRIREERRHHKERMAMKRGIREGAMINSVKDAGV